MKFPKPKVGDTVMTVRPMRIGEPRVEHPKVVKVGRSYFYVKTDGSHYDDAYRLEDWRSKETYGHRTPQCFPSQREYFQSKEIIRIHKAVAERIGQYTPPSDVGIKTWRAIEKLLFTEDENDGS